MLWWHKYVFKGLGSWKCIGKVEEGAACSEQTTVTRSRQSEIFKSYGEKYKEGQEPLLECGFRRGVKFEFFECHKNLIRLFSKTVWNIQKLRRKVQRGKEPLLECGFRGENFWFFEYHKNLSELSLRNFHKTSNNPRWHTLTKICLRLIYTWIQNPSIMARSSFS